MVELEQINNLPPYPIQHLLTSDIRKEAGRRKNKELISMWAGQASAMSKKQTAKELIDVLTSDYKKVISNLHKHS
jgi:nitronate monooxygenase